jgi:hypothetical protein
MVNIYKYLNVGGVLAINVKNYKDDGILWDNINKTNKFNLVEDIYEIIVNSKFNYLESLDLENISRVNGNNELIDNNEKIMVFSKDGSYGN